MAKVPPLSGIVTVHLDFYQCRVPGSQDRAFSRDEDNARSSGKAAQDALQDAGIIQSDGARNVRVGRTVLHRTAKQHKGQCCLVVTLETEVKS